MPRITHPSKISPIQSALSRVWNSLTHLTQQDLEGTWKDIHFDRVTYPKGMLPSDGYHLIEEHSALQSLEKFQDAILNALTDPFTSEDLRKVYQDLYDACQNTIDYRRGKVYGSDPPLGWPDPKGDIPL